MNPDPSDETSLRVAIGEARRERAQLRRQRVPVPDSVHLIFTGGPQGTFNHVVAQMPASPYEGAPGRPRYRDLGSLRQFLDEIARDAPALRERLATDKTAGTLAAVLFCHAMAGTGAELQMVGSANSTGRFAWEIVRAPIDGGPNSLGTDADERALRRAFGRELTLAAVWLRALSRARAGETVLEEIEHGYWIHASPANSDTLETGIQEVLARPGQWQRVDLRRPGTRATTLHPDFTQWAPEFSAEIQSGALRAGALVDSTVAAAHLVGVVEHQGLRLIHRPGTSSALVTEGDVSWPVDADLLGIATVVLGHFLDESAAAFIGVVRASIDRLREVITAVRAARPEHRFDIDGVTVWATRRDGSPGQSISLLPLVAQWGPGTVEFEREIRFACDPLPPGSDPTRVCPCGAPARVQLRLIPGVTFDAVQRRFDKKPLAERGQWSRGAQRHVAAVVITCEVHERYALRAELAAAGLEGMALDTRLAEDRLYESYEITAGMRVSPGGQRAAFVRGDGIASTALSDELLSALHLAIGAPFIARNVTAAVEALPPNGLCLYDTTVDPAWLAAQLTQFAMTMMPGQGELLTLGWPVDIHTRPVGRFLPAQTSGANRDDVKPAVRSIAATVTKRGK